MMYGAMSLGGIAVLASLISRSVSFISILCIFYTIELENVSHLASSSPFHFQRRRNINMDDHLLNGAVDKRKNTFAGLFQKKPNNSASELSTNYVAA